MFHTAIAAVFYLVSRCLLATGFSVSDETPSNWLNASAALGALVFSIHPLRVESVAWATERRDVLSGFFYLATLYFYLQMATGVKARRFFYLAIVTYGMSLLAKATSMTLPLVLILLDVYPLRRLPWQASRWGNHGGAGTSLPVRCDQPK